VGFREAEGRRTSQERRSRGAKESHIEESELRQLAQLGRQPFELIVVDLKHALGQITTQAIRFSHVEPLELCQLADFYWQRRELILADLKERWRRVRSRSNCLECRT
jgi:hypothetical protein